VHTRLVWADRGIKAPYHEVCHWHSSCRSKS